MFTNLFRHTTPCLVLYGITLLLLLSLGAPQTLHAGSLSPVSDTLSTSAPATPSNHTILFTTTTLIPALGTIVVTPHTGAFNIPASLDFSDVDLAVNGTEQLMGNSAGNGSGSQFGVHVTAGTTGIVRFTLNDTDSVAAGSVVRIKIGTNAAHTVSGDAQITNPASVGSYNITITTKNNADTTLDSSQFGIAIVNTVGIDSTDGTVSTPTMSPITGNFSGSIDVTLSSTTSGASIYYTTDGTTPSAGSTLYTGTLTFIVTTTLKAIAIKSGMNDSSVASETYTKTVTPPPPPPPGGGGGGTITPPSPAPQPPPPSPSPSTNDCDARKGDLNCDGRVNLVDLSILMYNWGTVKNNPRADINVDGKVNLIDFSILLYFWTD